LSVHAGQGQILPLLQAVENELDATRYAQFFENSKEIITNDLLFVRGWSPRSVAILCYSLTAGLVAAALITRRMDYAQTLVVITVICGGLLVVAVRLGSLRSEERPRNNAATPKVRWQRQSHWPV
jgi:hypothetical protein